MLSQLARQPDATTITGEQLTCPACMATHEHPPNFEMLHGCPTPPPNASSMYGPPRFLSEANHMPPPYKRTVTPKPLHTPPAELTPIGQNQFRFTRAQSVEHSRPSSVSGHAYAGTTPQESEYEESLADESDDESQESNDPRLRVDDAEFELEELGSSDADDEDIQVIHPDHCSDAKSEKSSAALEDTGVMDRLKGLHVSESSTDDDAQKERIYLRKKKRWSAGLFKRTHAQSVEGESSYSDDDPRDDNKPGARRLRRKLRGPDALGPGPWDRRGSLIFEDKGFPNTNNIEEVEEPEDGGILHSKGPPSIPSDDAFTLDELPFWGGSWETMDVGGDSE